MRRLLPKECFKDRDFQSSRHAARKLYSRIINKVEGKGEEDEGKGDQEAEPATLDGDLAAIVPGSSHNANKVLSWLVG